MSTTPLPDLGSPAPPEPAPERRIALLPVLIGVVAVVVAAALTIAIVSLATRVPPPAAPSTPAASAPPSIAPTEAAPVAPPPPPRPEAGPGECVDALGDGGTVDLDTVRVALTRDELVARFTLDTIPEAGETLLGITAIGRDDRTVLLAVRLIDGRVDEVFTVALRDAGSDDDDDNRGRDNDGDIDGFDERRATVEGRDVTVTFPDDVVNDLGRTWSWSAASSNGDSGDRCPDDGQVEVQR